MKIYDNDGKIDEDVEDILYELGNVGVGQVGNTIGQIMGIRIEIGVPDVKKADIESLKHISQEENEKIGVQLKLVKTLNGTVLMVLNKKFAVNVIEKIKGEKVLQDDFIKDEDNLSIFSEFANMAAASYMNAMASYTGLRIYVSPVTARVGSASDLAEWGIEQLNKCCSEALSVNTNLKIVDADGSVLEDVGHFVVMPDELSVSKIVDSMNF